MPSKPRSVPGPAVAVKHRTPARDPPAIAAITELGGWVVTEPRGPYQTVVEVNMVYHENEQNERLDNNQVTDEALSYVPKFKNLQRLLLKSTQATDEAMANIRGMEHVERVYLWNASLVTDEGVAHLATDTEVEGIELVKRLLGYLPQNNNEDPPQITPYDPTERMDEALNSLIPEDEAHSADCDGAPGSRPVDPARMTLLSSRT